MAEFPSVVGVEVPAGANLVASMNAGLARTSGEFVALTDDDAEPRPDWLARLLPYFDDPGVGGVGGRDDQAANPGEAADVGRVQWFGRVIGNHHLGVGPPRDVDVLKGVNCCFRGNLLRSVGFDRRLRGRGNVSHWELALCLRLRRDGWRLVYDPAIRVDHHPRRPPRRRRESTRRVRRGSRWLDMAYNETLVAVLAPPAAPHGKARHTLAWSSLASARASCRASPTPIRLGAAASAETSAAAPRQRSAAASRLRAGGMLGSRLSLDGRSRTPRRTSF